MGWDSETGLEARLGLSIWNRWLGLRLRIEIAVESWDWSVGIEVSSLDRGYQLELGVEIVVSSWNLG